MNKMGKLVFSAVSVFGIAACAVSSTDEVEVLGESQDALVTCNGTVSNGFFGSDTLSDAMSSAISLWGGNLTYLGTGSGNGEKCLRGTGPASGSGAVTCGGVTYCNGTKDQTLAPMSRDFNGACLTGDKSNRIAKDAVALWTKSTQAATNVTTVTPVPPGLPALPVDKVKGAFCGDGTGSPASCALTDTWGEFAAGSSNPSNALNLYRRDDNSGTTEAFKAMTGCTNFCSNVQMVVPDAVSGCRRPSDSPGTTSLPCSMGDSCTVCLGKVVANDVDALAYAGLDATNAGAKKLTVDGTPASVGDVRSGAYKYSRYLYLNEGNGTRAAAEQDFLDWAFGVGAYGPPESELFEDALISNGFVACTDPNNSPRTALNCGAGKCP